MEPITRREAFKADLGDGRYINPIVAGDHAASSIACNPPGTAGAICHAPATGGGLK